MPWMMQKSGEKACVYKKGADGKPEGEALHCYTGEDAEQKCKDYMKALYANADHESIPPSLREFQGESLDQKLQAIRDAFYRMSYSAPTPSSCYVKEIFDGFVILEAGNELYKASYSIDSDGKVVFEDREKWQRVKITYAEQSMPEFGDSHPWHEGRPGEIGGSTSTDKGVKKDEGGKESVTSRAKSLSAAAENATKKAMESGKPKDHAKARDAHMHAAEANLNAYRETRKSDPEAAQGYKRAVADHEKTATVHDKHAGKYRENFSSFLFVELSKSADLKVIDGLAAGTFVSMTGEEVAFEASELETYIDNTNKIIESTKTESGEIVGLPIDMNSHDHKGGAGWIKGLQLDKARNVIQFMVEWTKEGAKVIKDNVRRFFSPSTDPNNKLILGGSLTNWPATRDNATGQILLRPVELSQSIKEIDMEKTIDEIVAEKVAAELAKRNAPLEPPAELDGASNPSIQELLQTPEAVEELGKKAQELAQAAIRAEKRKLHVVEFVSRTIGGTTEKPFGLRGIKPNELVALLLALPEKQARAVEKILEATLDSAIDFAQYGFDSDGFVQKPQLPEPLKRYAREWVASGKDIQEFFKQNPEVGDPDNFNLAEFAKKEE